ncbi:E3 ubiquitin-protein ligase synoviolin [Rhizophlyctis rosea]|uniref:E3 ubiquitin-protein ligase synoviolin n=1 Tax=Rhizophlyctis rosea TaxID=64517 RepID=A0AAD5S535_9FUNG|nr:E3 ubiquitin-protein ligase synoviolin [Rhizophlyctis rosea]
MRLAIYGAVTTVATAAVILNAWLQRGQFFTACIHLTRSSASNLVLFNMALFLTLMFGKGMQKLFFGNLRALEVEHTYERAWFAVTETALAMTIFKDDFDMKFVAFFGCLLLVKIFHWITKDRVDFMEQSPNMTLKFHARMISIISILTLVDILMITYAAEDTLLKGATMMIVFGFEYMILLSMITSTAVKYCLHTIDLRRETPWEDKSMYMFYMDLIEDFCKLVTYVFFFVVVLHYYGIPLHIIRDLYITLRSFLQRCRDLVQYRRATANMQERYPNATAEELAGTDRTCIICREEMEVDGGVGNAGAAEAGEGGAVPPPPAQPAAGAARPQGGPPNVPKKLPSPPPAAPAVPPAAAPGGQPAAPFNDLNAALQQFLLAQQPLANPQPNAHAPPAPAPAPGAQPAGGAPNPSAGQHPISPVAGVPQLPIPNILPSPTGTAPTILNTLPSYMYPLTLTPLVPLPGVTSPASASPHALDHLTDDELIRLEGTSREAIIARINELARVQKQITGVITQLAQISQLMGTGPLPGGNLGTGVAEGSGAGSSRSSGGGDEKGKGVPNE